MAALVTGASAGIGREFARQLSVRKHDVVLVARDRDRLDALAHDLERAYGTKPEVLAADLVTDGGIAAVEARIADGDHPVDIVVNNAGFSTFGQFSELDVEKETDEIRLNVLALVRLTHAALAVMEPRGDGAVVNVSSLAGRSKSANGGPAYTASKAGMMALTHSFNIEECVNGLRATALCPGEVATPILKSRPVEPSDEEKARMLQEADLGRTIRFIAEQPAHVCINELVISPVWNRIYTGAAERLVFLVVIAGICAWMLTRTRAADVPEGARSAPRGTLPAWR